jgi:hypothetical protein
VVDGRIRFIKRADPIIGALGTNFGPERKRFLLEVAQGINLSC